jgi:hypothetical protein
MKSSLKLTALACLFLAIGAVLGAQFLGEIQDSDASDAPQFDRQAEVITELRRTLTQAKTRIGLLEEQLEDPIRAAPIHSGIHADSNSAHLAAAGELISSLAEISSETDTALSMRLEELQANLEKAKNGELELSDAEVQAKVQDLKGAFEQASAAKDGPSALKAMMALSNLDKRAFPALIDLWTKMRKNGWYGLNGGQRRLWFNAKVFHWALEGEQIGSSGKDSKAFRIQALRYLPWYEPDPAKQAESYAKFLGSVESPYGELSAKQKKLLGRGWRRNGDLFRGTIERLGSVNDPKSAAVLSRFADDPNLPTDVRAMALSGLGRQSGPSRDIDRLIENGLRDQSGSIRRTAIIAQARRKPPATGWLVKGVNKKSPLFKKVGIGGVITSYNGRKIRNGNDLRRAIARSKGKKVMIEVNNHGIISKVNLQGGKDLRISGEQIRK